MSCDDFFCAFSIPSNIVRWEKVNHFNQHILAWWQEPIPGDCLHCDRLSVCSVGSRFPCHTHQIREKVSYSLNQIIILYSVEILSGWFCKLPSCSDILLCKDCIPLLPNLSLPKHCFMTVVNRYPLVSIFCIDTQQILTHFFHF